MRKGFKHKKDYRGTPNERFWNMVITGDSCWKWKGATGQKGHAIFSLNQRAIRAHRYSFEIHFGPVPKGMQVCHTCDNPPCTNPEHLFLGTNKDNVDDMVSKKRHTFGSRNPMAKLKESDVLRIRALKDAGFKNFEIAAATSMSQSAICQILKRQRWMHV